jgi:hypothetical protein
LGADVGQIGKNQVIDSTPRCGKGDYDKGEKVSFHFRKVTRPANFRHKKRRYFAIRINISPIILQVVVLKQVLFSNTRAWSLQ